MVTENAGLCRHFCMSKSFPNKGIGTLAESSEKEDLLLRALVGLFRNNTSNIENRIPHHDARIDKLTLEKRNSFRKAAVLIPVIKPTVVVESRIILTVRSEALSSHGGQVSFPGGTRELIDENDIDTALRESEEEIGLAPNAVEIIGQLGEILLPSGFAVTPVIGLVEPDPVLSPCPIEVHEIIMVPTELLLNTGAYGESTVPYEGISRKILEVHYQGHRIWGATAAILHHLASHLQSE